MADSNQTTSIITLNVNHLNIAIQRQRLSETIKKKSDPNICCLQDTHCKYRDRLKIKRKKLIS